MDQLTGRVIYPGDVSGRVLKSELPIGFFGHVDDETGEIKEKEHPLYGSSISNTILVFPHAKGSTVGSYILYSLKKKNLAPAALVLEQCEIIVAVGAIISEIPTLDEINISALNSGDNVHISGEVIRIE